MIRENRIFVGFQLRLLANDEEHSFQSHLI